MSDEDDSIVVLSTGDEILPKFTLISNLSQPNPFNIGKSLPPQAISQRVDVVGCIRGVFCLSAKPSGLSLTSTIMLWNPATSQFRNNFPTPKVSLLETEDCFGFCYNCDTNDFLILRISIFKNHNVVEPPAVEIYSLSQDSWREIGIFGLPFSIKAGPCQAIVDGKPYWIGHSPMNRSVVWFNVQEETFGHVLFPEPIRNPRLLNFNNRLAVVGKVSVPEGYAAIWRFNVWLLSDEHVFERKIVNGIRLVVDLLGCSMHGGLVMEMVGGLIGFFGPHETASFSIEGALPSTFRVFQYSPSLFPIPSQPAGLEGISDSDLPMHKLVFHDDVLPDGTKLFYFARGKKCLLGYKKRFRILCSCCIREVSPSQFEAHAGWSSRRKPYLHIYTSLGVSLSQLSIKLSKPRKLSTEGNDYLCSICADGGDLLCCDSCPRAFHKECVSLPSIPIDKWKCNYCLNKFEKEISVERNANAERIGGIDPVEEITRRCIRIVETADADIGGCALCGGHGFSITEFGPQTVLLCDQCEKKYHVFCLKDRQMDDLKEFPEGKWFCCMDCKRIHASLQTLVGNGEERLQEPLVNVIKEKLIAKGSDSSAYLDITWGLLSGKMVSMKTKALLVKAVAIFRDRFDPISNVCHSDLIPAMVYGRNVRDHEFEGMFCAILSVNSNVVSAGLVRIFGHNVAEVPLVATSTGCQGQGYFQVLFSCIEDLLRSLKVRKLVLPAADDQAESLWTKKFGFKKIAEDELKEYRTEYPLMVGFQETSMLHKTVA